MVKMNSTIKRYLLSISRYPILTEDEEKELAKKAKKGDKEAFNKLINCNLRLVVKIAKELNKGKMKIDDIIQNGNIGLIKAVEKYDPERKVRFSTYASYWIKQSILRGFIKPGNDLSISYRKYEINKKIKKFIQKYKNEENRTPSIDKITKEVKVKKNHIIDILCSYKSSIMQNINQNLNDEFIFNQIIDNRYNPENIYEKIELVKIINEIKNNLNERERNIINRRYFVDRKNKATFHELANEYNLTAEAIRQIECKIFNFIKKRYSFLALYTNI